MKNIWKLLLVVLTPNATKELMCKKQFQLVEGYIYDCDFNQMLDLKINSKNNTVFNCKIQGLVDKKSSFPALLWMYRWGRE